jgi:hypothetical protein
MSAAKSGRERGRQKQLYSLVALISGIKIFLRSF